MLRSVEPCPSVDDQDGVVYILVKAFFLLLSMVIHRIALLILSLAVLPGCVRTIPVFPLVEDRLPPQTGAQGDHIVLAGETLYAIAWRYGRDYRELASINRIKPPYRIYPGQNLHLLVKEPEKNKSSLFLPNKPYKSINKDKGEQVEVASAALQQHHWIWPAKGKIVQYFAKNNQKYNGIAIAGREGAPVCATASGKVVYSGSGLRGLGRLIIIKHDSHYLSAYANNRALWVQEGDRVKAGQKIAEMGRNDDNKVMLHFEVRRNGKPVDPLRYLAKQ